MTLTRFSDVVHLNTSRIADPLAAGIERFVGLEHIEPENLHIRNWGLVSDGVTFTNSFKPGQVLFGKRRAYQRKVALADFEGVCSSDIYVFESKDPDVLLPELLPFICQSEGFYQHAVMTSAGSLSPRTNWGQLADYEFPLPPIDEQRRIADLLWAADNVCDELANTRSYAEKVRVAYHYQLFSEVLKRDVEKNVKIGNLFNPITEKGFSMLPILSVTINGKIVRRNSLDRNISDETGEEKYIRVLPGDLAYNTMRLWQGAIGLVEEEGLISPAYTVMRLCASEYSVEYFLDLFRSSKIQNQYKRFVKGIASDRWRIYFKDLATLELNLPSPLRSKEISSLLGSIDQSIDCINAHQRNTLDLKIKLIETLLTEA
jgi:type I restriction enzyme S subunit